MQAGIKVGAVFKDIDGSSVEIMEIKKYDVKSNPNPVVHLMVKHEKCSENIRVSTKVLVNGLVSTHVDAKLAMIERRIARREAVLERRRELLRDTEIKVKKTSSQHEKFIRENGKLGMIWLSITNTEKHHNWTVCDEWLDYKKFESSVCNAQGYQEYGSLYYPMLTLRYKPVDDLSAPRYYSPENYGIYMTNEFMKTLTP